MINHLTKVASLIIFIDFCRLIAEVIDGNSILD